MRFTFSVVSENLRLADVTSVLKELLDDLENRRIGQGHKSLAQVDELIPTPASMSACWRVTEQDAPVIGIIIDGGELQYCRSYEPILVEVFDQDNYDAETTLRRAEMDQTLATIEAMPVAN